MYKLLGRSVLIAALVTFTGVAAFAQKDKDRSLTCRENSWNNGGLMSNCEIREQTLAPSGPIAIDGRQNGGISVKGWDQNQILIRARVQTSAPSASEAEALGKQVRIETSGSKIHATGPETKRNQQWDVSYEVFVPRRADISLETHNGGIAIADVNGKIDFNALNGGVVLKRVGGAVRGSTTNGGLVIELSGDHWDGESMDVNTTNGGVIMSVPENYSAHIETGTVNGGVNTEFPVTVKGEMTRQIAINLGSGGATVRAMTTNGGVHLKKLTNNE
jgi:DUF4097 and DUF4098 domain-containing protein YvlB